MLAALIPHCRLALDDAERRRVLDAERQQPTDQAVLYQVEVSEGCRKTDSSKGSSTGRDAASTHVLSDPRAQLGGATVAAGARPPRHAGLTLLLDQRF